ncbi:MAG: hypothetical protein ACE5ID_09810 [Acidobacteriota bacterium]
MIRLADLLLSGTAAILMILPATGCRPEKRAMEKVVDDYIHAIQERDDERLLALYAPMARALAAAPQAERASLRKRLLAAIDARHAAYLTGREEGHLPLKDDGIVLVRALRLGRGTYYENVEAAVSGADRAYLVQEVRLAYRSMPLQNLPVGTTIYLLGEPLGTVYHPVIGRRRKAVRRLLERVWVRWSLIRAEGEWLVQAVGPDQRPPLSYTDTTRF